MAEAFFSAVNYPLSLLVQNIESGEIALSGIQRPFVWPNARVRDLFDSMYRGFPVGYLLFAPYDGWRTSPGGKVPRLLIVDGQQRLTSLYSVLKGSPVMREDFREERIEIAFRPSDGQFEVSDASIQNDPEFIPDVGPLLSGQVPQYRFVREFLERLRTRRGIDEGEEARLSSAIYRLYDIQSYPFTVLQLSRALDEEQVAEVFVRINSRGVSLGVADFVLTLMAVAWEDGRRQLETFCRATREVPAPDGSSPGNPLLHPTPDQLLRVVAGLAFRRGRLGQVYSILQGIDPETRRPSVELRSEQFRTLQDAQNYALDTAIWREFLESVTEAGYRSTDMIPSQMGILRCYTLFLIGRQSRGVDTERLRSVMARWMLFASLTGRYAGSAESRLEADLARFRDVADADRFFSVLEGIMSEDLSEEFWTTGLPAELTTTSARSPALLAYHAALVILEADGLFSDTKVSAHLGSAPGLLEQRRIFTKRQLGRRGGKGKETNQAANLVFAGSGAEKWATAQEAASMLAAAASGEALARTKRLHALPEGWAEMEYGAFLEARRRAMALVIKEAVERLAARPSGADLILSATRLETPKGT